MAVFWPAAILTEEIRIPKAVKGLLLVTGTVVYTICFGMRWGVW